jgi:hypothetical protein
MTEEAKVIPEEFSKVIKDFIEDLKTTFPEYLPLINKWWKKRSDFDYIEEDNKRHEAIQKSERTSIEMLFSFCQKKYHHVFLIFCIKMQICSRRILILTLNFYHIFILRIYGNVKLPKKHVKLFGNIYN